MNIPYSENENVNKFNLLRNRDKESRPAPLSQRHCKNIKTLCESRDPRVFQIFTSSVNLDILRTLEETQENNYPLINFDSIGLPKRYILLDSRNRNLSKADYSWDLVPFNVNQKGQLNTLDTITQILEVSCQPFRMPILPGTSMQYYEKIKVGIQEFNSQGISLISNTAITELNYYHFELKVVNRTDTYLDLEPVNTWRPGKIISYCDRITLSFYSGTEKLRFFPDEVVCDQIAGNPTVFVAPFPHNLSTGDLVYILSGELDNNIGYSAVILTPTSFSVLGTTTLSKKTSVYFARWRILMQLNFICLEN